MALVNKNGLEVLELQGTPEQMGWDHGTALKERVQFALEGFLRNSRKNFEVPYPYLLEQAQICLSNVPEDYVTEMRFLAEAAEVGFDEILTLNCIADVDGLYMKQLHHCCNFVVGPPATSNGIFAHGRNLDFPPSSGAVQKSSVVIQREPLDGHGHATWSIAWAGFIGTYTGMSSAQVTAAEIGVPARHSSLNGTPMGFLIRKVLETSDSSEDAVDCLHKAKRTCGFNLAVGDGKKKDAKGVEVTGTSFGYRGMRKGMLIVDDVCFCRATSRHRLTYPAGAFRYARLMQLLSNDHGNIELADCFRYLADDFDLAKRQRGGRTYRSIRNRHTIQSVLMLPGDNAMYVSFDTPLATSCSRFVTNLTDCNGCK